ncbi:QacE family quaternary ammonium compound efflux SMR transporter [Actinoplanes sp. ATCC 53533]|uniref:DMT family transporter n=1 Tax=Actinoplanes sp. ATCC 53533 TaxID=1288362 RepID=UPI000F7935C4|nr:SMR family transporter [Actinoplanes sp. ATCC 53533]RSM48942.1 QacE family quaternary ammonium compound efflux SMR transporter [Actinoplanes sp. ATCC 53533]
MKKWLMLTAAIGSEVAATLALKAALDQPAWYALVTAGYVAAFAFLAVCLRLGMKIGVAYGIWGAGGVTVTAILSAVIYGEPLTALMGLGIALIIAGVLTVELGSQRAAREHEVPA